MQQKQLAWPDGNGSISVAFIGDGDGAITLSSEANTGVDRAVELRVSTLDGSIEHILRVEQPGTREYLSDSLDSWLTDSDNKRLMSLK